MRSYRFKRSQKGNDSGDEVIKKRTRTYRHCDVKVESDKGNKVCIIFSQSIFLIRSNRSSQRIINTCFYSIGGIFGVEGQAEQTVTKQK